MAWCDRVLPSSEFGWSREFRYTCAWTGYGSQVLAKTIWCHDSTALTYYNSQSCRVGRLAQDQAPSGYKFCPSGAHQTSVCKCLFQLELRLQIIPFFCVLSVLTVIRVSSSNGTSICDCWVSFLDYKEDFVLKMEHCLSQALICLTSCPVRCCVFVCVILPFTAWGCACTPQDFLPVTYKSKTK